MLVNLLVGPRLKTQDLPKFSPPFLLKVSINKMYGIEDYGLSRHQKPVDLGYFCR